MARTHRPLAKHRTHSLLLQFRSRYRPDQDVGGSQGGYPSDPLTLPVLPKPPQKTLNQRQPIQNIQTESLVLLSTKEITFPVLPPTFFRVLPRPWAAFVRAGPADADTRVRPSVALAAADEAVCWALEAASEADEACLTVVVVVLRVKACCDCRRATARETATGILTSDCVGISERQEGDRAKQESLEGQSSAN